MCDTSKQKTIKYKEKFKKIDKHKNSHILHVNKLQESIM